MTAWAGLGYYSRARNLLACARTVVERHDGRFPRDESVLLAPPGIGPYTAGAIAAIAFGLAAPAADGNVERVVSRLSPVELPLPAARAEPRRPQVRDPPSVRPGDWERGGWGKEWSVTCK